MPITIVSGNLNQYGNAGQFESDRSTWGFADSHFVSTRSPAQQTAGLYSAHVLKNDLSSSLLLPCRWTSELGKKYFVKAKVRVPSAAPVSAGANEITLNTSLTNLLIVSSVTSRVDKTVTEATDTWVDIEAYYEHTNSLFPSFNEVSHIHINGSATLNGEIYVDQFEVYEFTGTPDEEPEPEPEPEPDPTDRIFLSKNPITLERSAPDGWDELTNFRLFNEVRVEDVADSGTYNSKLKTELPPDSDGNVTFYLNEALRDAFTFTPPTLQATDIIRLTDRIKRFKNFVGELQDDEITPPSLEELDVDLALWGGIDKFNYPGLNYLTSYLPTNKKFLTWAPVEKYIDRLQEDYLNFLIYNEEIGELKLRIKAYFDDNTDETDVTKTKTPVAYRQLYQIPSGPYNSGASLINPAKNLVKYELALLDQDDEEISEVRTYHTAVKAPLTRYFMFLNSLGSFEVLRFVGQANRQTEFSREVVQKFLPHDYAAEDGEFAVNSVLSVKKNNFSSGYIKGKLAAEWHEYMEDFLLSPRIFNITTGSRIPVVITGASMELQDQNYERFIRFDAKPGYDNISFTPSSL